MNHQEELKQLEEKGAANRTPTENARMEELVKLIKAAGATAGAIKVTLSKSLTEAQSSGGSFLFQQADAKHTIKIIGLAPVKWGKHKDIDVLITSLGLSQVASLFTKQAMINPDVAGLWNDEQTEFTVNPEQAWEVTLKSGSATALTKITAS